MSELTVGSASMQWEYALDTLGVEYDWKQLGSASALAIDREEYSLAVVVSESIDDDVGRDEVVQFARRLARRGTYFGVGHRFIQSGKTLDADTDWEVDNGGRIATPANLGELRDADYVPVYAPPFGLVSWPYNPFGNPKNEGPATAADCKRWNNGGTRRNDGGVPIIAPDTLTVCANCRAIFPRSILGVWKCVLCGKYDGNNHHAGELGQGWKTNENVDCGVRFDVSAVADD